MIKLTSYKNAITMGEKALKKALVPVRVKRAKKQAELEMLKLEEDIATKEAKLHELCSSEDLDFPAIIDLQDSIGLIERRQSQYQTILDEMFPDE